MVNFHDLLDVCNKMNWERHKVTSSKITTGVKSLFPSSLSFPYR